METAKRVLIFFRSFSKNLTFITAGSLFIHFIVMIINIYASRTGTVYMDRELFEVIFSGITYPVVMAYGILIFLTLSLYQKLEKTEKRLKNAEYEKEQYRNALKNMQMVSGQVIQETSAANMQLATWIRRREANGTAPKTVVRANTRIGKALETLSFSLFVYPYAGRFLTSPVLTEQIQLLESDRFFSSISSSAVE
ncbi:MAG: hypothetical protein ACOC2H_07885 [Spirochaetota bacterium]